MRAGKLRSRVIILAPPSAETPQSAHGTPTGAWTTVDTVWADVEEIGGDTQFRGDQFNTVKQLRVTLRYFSGLTEKHRFSFNSRTFHILHVGTDQKLTEMICDCIEVKT